MGGMPRLIKPMLASSRPRLPRDDRPVRLGIQVRRRARGRVRERRPAAAPVPERQRHDGQLPRAGRPRRAGGHPGDPRRLGALRSVTSPFTSPVPAAHARGAQWVQPRLVGEVALTEWTADLVLRHPSWRGVRPTRIPMTYLRTAEATRAPGTPAASPSWPRTWRARRTSGASWPDYPPGRRRVDREHMRRADGAPDELAAAVRADAVQDLLCAVAAPGALVGADEHVRRRRVEIPVAAFAVRPQLQHWPSIGKRRHAEQAPIRRCARTRTP
jgi:hypothetical protein